ncbi:AAA family ATPase [Sinomonas susongensis]|uniref:AAA family ATPase n=1 Tax=Sinomonas susongensis TaxID=1324851 RepID=UPI001107F09A|nr:AAA family ATPase [Sinomonas susongensis]
MTDTTASMGVHLAGTSFIRDTARQDLAAAAAEALRREGPAAVLVVGESGSGKTHLLEGIVEALDNGVEVMRIHTGRSLRSIMYAALIERLPRLAPEDVQDRISVLRALWAELHRMADQAAGRQIVLVVDDAQDLDDGSAGLIAEAVASSWVRLLAAGTSRNGLPRDFLDMWHDGIAERIELGPLTLEESRLVAERRLGGRPSLTAANVLHALSGGNPLHLLSLIDEALEAGTLVSRQGIWILTGGFTSRGDALAETVRSSMEQLTPADREALMLVALTEPLPRAAARALIDRDTLDKLSDLGWFADPGADGLRIRFPLEADAVRRMTTATRRLHIYRHALGLGGDEIRQPANELRLLELALDTGATLPAAELVRGASAAVRRFRNELGLRAASLIDRDAERSLARGLVARAYLNLGDPQAALAALNVQPATPTDARDVLTGSLLKFSARVAVGELDGVEEDAAALERAANAVDSSSGSGLPFGPGAKESVLRRARLLRALAALERADFDAVSAAVAHDGRLPQASLPPVERNLWLFLEADTQLAAGRYETAARAAGLALSDSGGDDEHFPLEEFGLVRYLSAALLAGDWASVDSVLNSYPGAHMRPIVVFGPGLYCARAYALLRQSRDEEARLLLHDVAENLELLDPLHLRGVANALAAWAAAAGGHAAEARERLVRAQQTAGIGSAAMRELAAMHSAGAQELLAPGSGLPELEAIAEADREAGRPGWELIARVLAFELGAVEGAERSAELAEAAQGAWAAAWGAWARAVAAGSGDGYLAAGDLFQKLGLFRRARAAYARAAGCFDSAGDRAAARRAGAAARACEGLPGSGGAGEQEEAILASLRLSRREQDVVDLAVEGLSDRQIADRLHLSVRTVEGHLHRSYAKLGIRSRDELHDAVQE